MTNATTTVRRPAPAAPPTRRLTLDSIQRNVGPAPDRILLTGTEGVGKTSWAAGAPSPIFICAEDGMPRALANVPRFPSPQSFDEVLEAIGSLCEGEHEFKTLVIDTVDWLEPMVWEAVCRKNSWESIEAPGYGKGYTAATDEWRRLLVALDRLRSKRGMEVILLAHASIRTFQNPLGPDYDRYEVKLHKGAAALVREWCDTNLFAIHEEFGGTDKSGKPTKKGVSTGRRVVHTERTAAWHAKNRHGLPPELALDYAEYAKAREAGEPASPAALIEEAERLVVACGMGDEEAATSRAFLQKNKDNATVLAKAVDKLRTKAAQKGGE